MEEKYLNERESLKLITQMIQNTQQNLEKGNGIPFLVFGYTTVAVSLFIWYFLSVTGDIRTHFLWFLIPMIGFPLSLHLNKKKEKGVKTFVDKAVGYVWMVLGLSGLMTSLIAMFLWNMPILFFIILLMGSGTAITGLIIRFTPITIGGFVGILLSLACLFVDGSYQILVFAALFVVMMVIPGHILYAKGRR